MPELPEVEIVRRGLAPVMVGARFARVELRRPNLRFDFPDRFAARLTGTVVENLARRGKYLLASLSTGETLVMHLGMSGRFIIQPGDRCRPGVFYPSTTRHERHDHVVFHMTGGPDTAVIFHDPRRFGFMDLIGDLERSRHFARMGPEPLDPGFRPADLGASLKARHLSIKSALLDQHIVAGIGNIYACEALFRAGISPIRKASSVTSGRAARLHAALQTVLTDAIGAGGSSVKDFVSASGSAGGFQRFFKVYDRAGEPCPACDQTIVRIIQAGRSTFYCRTCQK